jgi:hypothetical protein
MTHMLSLMLGVRTNNLAKLLPNFLLGEVFLGSVAHGRRPNNTSDKINSRLHARRPDDAVKQTFYRCLELFELDAFVGFREPRNGVLARSSLSRHSSHFRRSAFFMAPGAVASNCENAAAGFAHLQQQQVSVSAFVLDFVILSALQATHVGSL